MIKDKFRNMRASLKRKIRDGEETAASPPATKRRRVAGLPNYYPSNVPGSVETQRNINKLKEASDASAVLQLMDVTFCARRHAIMEEGAGAEELRDTYPPLFSSAEVRNITNRFEYSQDSLQVNPRTGGGLSQLRTGRGGG